MMESTSAEWEDMPSEEILRENLKSRMRKLITPVKTPKTVTKKITRKKKDKSVRCPICDNKYADRGCLQAHMEIHTNTEPYPCLLCPYKGKTRKYLTSHMRRSHRDPQHKCDICDKYFHYPAKLAVHMLVHTGEKPYKCKVCGKAFRAKYTLDTHSYIHTNKKPYKCQYCEYACRDGSTLRRHHDRHKGKQKNYKCSYCPKEYDTKAYLRDHVAGKHFSVDMKVHSCDQCDKKFTQKYSLKNHVRTVHDKAMTCTCDICGHELTSWHNLSAHLRSHINVRPFKCSYMKCKKKFKDKTALKRHEITHWPDRQLSCDICDRHFARRTRLNEHLRQHGIQKSPKCYECDYCGMSFNNKARLIRHIGKHVRTRNTYICDICKFVTHRKLAIVMHLKYGHGPETDLLCKICNKKYKLHAYLISHYFNYHNIRYKTVREVKTEAVYIKEEPEDPMTDMEVDIAEIEKQEAFADLNLELDEDKSYSKSVLSEDIAQSMCRKEDIGPETALDLLFRENLVEKTAEDIKKNENINLDIGKEEYVRRRIKKMLMKARQRKIKAKQKQKVNVLEEMRQQYNDRIRTLISNKGGKENFNVKFINMNKNNSEKERTDHNENTTEQDNDIIQNNTPNEETTVNSQHRDGSINNLEAERHCDSNDIGTDNNNIEEHNRRDANAVEKEDIIECDNNSNINKDDDIIERNSNSSVNETVDTNIEEDNRIGSHVERDGNSDKDMSDEDGDTRTKEQKNIRLKINTHQCYICYKLFETRSKLLQHCQIHFDVCSKKCLKKCPLCEYVTDLTITRHLKLVHNIKIKRPYYTVKEKSKLSNKSRYYYNVNDKIVKEIEIIPSVSNLNKIAYVQIDKKNRENEDKAIAKTKLVKKGGEWVVEKEVIDINEYALPEFDEDEIKKLKNEGSSYLDKLQALSHVAKKKNVNMLFPCEHCDKICRAFSGLKLHARKHQTNPKPFKKKVWKHKLDEVQSKKVKSNVKVRNKSLTTKNRLANPKPIVNKHKCDDKLKEFYENNIRGADIEFWQFLKIYNKMTRENITDFEELENRRDFGIHEKMNVDKDNIEIGTNTDDNNIIKDTNTINVSPKTVNNRINRNKIKNKFVRKIILSKREHLKRLQMIEKLREKIRESCRT